MEFPIYGLGHVGVSKPDIDIDTDTPPTTTFTRYLNEKYYELTDHLGNVRAVLGDRKLTSTPGAGNYYGDIRSYSHPYPFGMPEPGRSWENGAEYRYGYNGMETDPEVKEGEGKHYTTYFRQYDPRLGRWWSTDPVVQLGESPYAAMYNNPIGYSDPLGNNPPVGGGDNPLDPGKGAKTFLEGASQLVGSGRGTSGGGWEAAKSLLNRQEAMKAHAPPRPRGRVITPQRRVSSRNVYHGGGSATTSPYVPEVAPEPLPVLSAHTGEWEESVWSSNTRRSAARVIGPTIPEFLFEMVDELFVGAQVFGNFMKGYSEHMDEPAFHLDGSPATRAEEMRGLVSLVFTVGGGVVGRAVGTGASRLFGAVASRFSLFSRTSGAMLESVVAAESQTIVPTGARLLDETVGRAVGVVGQTESRSAVMTGAQLLEETAAGVPDGQFYSVAFEMSLSPTSYPGVSRYMHFKEANVALDVAMQTNPLLGQLGISIPRSASGSILGKSPTNWVWHHDINKGVLQLVPKSQHPDIPGGIFWETMHLDRRGGFSRWGKKK